MSSLQNKTIAALLDSVFARLRECEMIADNLTGGTDFPKMEEIDPSGLLGETLRDLQRIDYRLSCLSSQLQGAKDILVLDCCTENETTCCSQAKAR